LKPHHVELLGATPGWLRYRLPRRCVRPGKRPLCIGQKQVWFLLQLTAQESEVRLDAYETPEFDSWRWVDFWYPLEHVVSFKRRVYAQALKHLAPFAEQACGASILECAPPSLEADVAVPRRERRAAAREAAGGGL
jgi:putative (di)nucleoside polyphosphate hydrolase